MTVSFDMIGKLAIGKESERFKPYEEVEYKSGWVNRILKFNCISGDNRFMLQVKGGKFADEHNEIFVFSKDGVDDNGNRIKGEGFRIPFKERLTHPRLDEVVEWKKFTIDLEEPGRRWKLQNAVEKLEEGKEFTEAELKELGVKSVDMIPEAYEKSCKKRKEFISEWDYAEFIYKVVKSDKYTDRKFRIRGEHQYQYSEDQGRFYENYVPNRIYLVADNEEEVATETATVYFNSESLSDVTEENGKYYVNAKIFVYDNSRKENIPCDYTFVFDGVKEDATEKEKKMVDAKVNLFSAEEDMWKEVGVVNTLIDGAQRTAIEFEDLDEDTQDNILMGLTTLEDVRAELGGSVYGDHIREARFTKLARGFSKGANDTVYTDDNMVIKPLNNEDEKDLFDESEDLFDEDEDLF